MTNVINTTLSNTSDDAPECQPSVWTWLMMVMEILDIILSLPTVPWALWIVIRNSTLKTELFIFNILCTYVISILLTLISFLIILVSSSTLINNTGFWFLYNIYLSGYPLFQCGLCFERYLAVVHPITYLKYRVMRYKLTGLASIWTMTLVVCVINVLFFNLQPLLLILILVVCMEMFFSFSILKVLKRSSPGDSRRKQENDMKRRALIIVVVLQIKLLFNYVPYILSNTFRDAFSDYLFYCYVFSVAINFCSFGHFFQAFLYLQRVGEISVPQRIRSHTCFRWSGRKVDV